MWKTYASKIQRMKSTPKTNKLPPPPTKSLIENGRLVVVHTYKEILWSKQRLYLLDGVTPTLDKQYFTVL